MLFRSAQFYERAGKVKTLGSSDRTGAISAIGAVSPPGGDISEPVSQATLRIVKVFWGLDYNLSYKRHFPAINWLQSYSLYQDKLADWYKENVSRDWIDYRTDMMRILQEEAELQEIVQLVGIDALSPADRVTLEAARSIREDYLQQNAFNDQDTYTTLNKQYRMIRVILGFYEKSQDAVKKGVEINDLFSMPVREKISRMKYIEEDEGSNPFVEIEEELSNQVQVLIGEKDR